MRTNHHHWPGLWPGLVLVSVGGGLLAREFGLLPPQVRWVDFWPLILVFAGVSSLLRARGLVPALLSLGFVAAGGFLLAGNLGFLAFSATRLWPVLLVLLGLAFLIRARDAQPHESRLELPGGADDDRVSKRIAFGGAEFKVVSQAWQGGALTVTAGGADIDLRHARLAPEGAVLAVRVLMGGVDIRVPDTWQVKCDVTPLLGGADDLTRSTQGSTSAPVLRVVGSVTLGGISIHN